MSLSNKMVKALIWSMLERLSVQSIQFGLGIILARILSPNEYGIVGLLTVIIAFLQVFVDSGFSKALIHKQDRTQVDVSTVFFFNLFVSICCYIFIWFGAPLIADFYKNPELIDLMRVLSISLLFTGLFSIPMTLFTIELDFKLIARSNLIAVILSGVIGVIMAYNGYGAWALVFQTVLKSFFTAVLMWRLLKWKPLYVFSKNSFSNLFSYGSNLLIGSILNTTVNNFSNLFIAKLMSTTSLGYYTRGTQFADLIYGIFSSVLDSVLLPSLASIQQDIEKLVLLTRSIIKSTALITAPVLLGLAVIAKPLIVILLTNKWLMAVPIMQILCIARFVTLISGINVNILHVIGRTDLALKQQYVKLFIRVVIIIIALQFGILYVALAELISTLIHFFINTYYPSKILRYGPFEQIKDLLPVIISSVLMISVMIFVMDLTDNNILKLLVASTVGFFVYVLFIYLFKVKEFFILLEKFKKFKNIT